MIRTLSDPRDEGQRFKDGEKAAADRATRHAGRAADLAGASWSDPLVAAVAEELLAQIHFRQGDGAERLKGLPAGGGTGPARLPASRLPVGCGQHLPLARTAAPQTGGPGRAGGGVAAFPHRPPGRRAAPRALPRRPGRRGPGRLLRPPAYVNEQIVELLIAQGRDADALRYAELAKARALQEPPRHAEGGVGRRPLHTGGRRGVAGEMAADVACVEYFLGSRRAWVFLVSTAGKVWAFPLADAEGKPLSSANWWPGCGSSSTASRARPPR